MELILKFLYVIRDLVSNNKCSIAIFTLLRNQPEDGS